MGGDKNKEKDPFISRQEPWELSSAPPAVNADIVIPSQNPLHSSGPARFMTTGEAKKEMDFRTFTDEIDIEEIEFLGQLGRQKAPTDLTRVYLANCRMNQVAVKVVTLPEDSSRFTGIEKDQCLDNLENEIRLLQNAKCHVPPLVGICRNIHRKRIRTNLGETFKPNLMLVMQKMEGDLESLILEPDANKRVNLTFGQRVKMAQQAAQALAWINGKNLQIVHRDLKLENFLYDKNFDVKLNDFGLSITCDRSSLVSDDDIEFVEGNFLYRAPERLLKRTYNYKSDVFSYGLILWQIVTGQPLPLAKKCENLQQLLDHMHERPPLSTWMPKSLQRLLADCWMEDPAKRPDFSEICARFPDIILDVEILDPVARAFWHENFVKNEEPLTVVPMEEFFSKFFSFLGITEEDFKNDLLLDQGAKIFKHLCKSTESITQKPQVTIEDFNRQIECWGPLHQPQNCNKNQNSANPSKDNKHYSIFYELVFVVETGWFYAHMTKEEAAQKLMCANRGTFLVRFGAQPGFSITKVTSEQKIIHIRVQKDSHGRWRTKGGSFRSLRELITGSKQLHLLKTPDQDSRDQIFRVPTSRTDPLAHLLSGTRISSNTCSSNYYVVDPDDFNDTPEEYISYN